MQAPGSPMAGTRFYCGSGGCNTDLCILCGRRKLPVFELHVGMGERTYPVEFQTPLLSVAIEYGNFDIILDQISRISQLRTT